jgi:hypothetical protein
MTEQQKFMSLIGRRLAERGIDHMVVGSVAADWRGHPRTTNDMDVIISTGRDAALSLAKVLKADGLYVDEASVLDAWQRRSMVNAIDPDTGWKVDLIMLDERPFSAAEFARRTREQTPAGEFFVQTAEDLILSKLLWAQEYESERQMRDAGAVFDVWRSRLDLAYMRRWASELGVTDIFERLFERPIRT